MLKSVSLCFWDAIWSFTLVSDGRMTNVTIYHSCANFQPHNFLNCHATCPMIYQLVLEIWQVADTQICKIIFDNNI